MGFDDSGNTGEISKEQQKAEQLVEVQVAAGVRPASISTPDNWETEWEHSMASLRELKLKSMPQAYLTLSEKELVDLRSIVLMNRALVTTFIQGLENKESKWHSGDGSDRQKLIATMMDMAQRLYNHNTIMRNILDKIQTRLDTPHASHPGTCTRV